MNDSQELKLLFLIQQTYASLYSLTNKLQIKGDKYFDLLTSRQFMTMMAILHLPEEKTTLNNIARKLGTSKQNIKTLIDSIAQKGYVATVPSIRDKRAINVRITDLGNRVMMEGNKRGLDFFADAFADFSIEELETLWKLLKKLYNFDGESLDGFEEDVSEKFDMSDDHQRKMLNGFLERRNQVRKKV